VHKLLVLSGQSSDQGDLVLQTGVLSHQTFSHVFADPGVSLDNIIVFKLIKHNISSLIFYLYSSCRSVICWLKPALDSGDH